MMRSVEIVLASVGIIVLSPLLAFLGLMLWLRHGWPILFRQTRVGLHGEPFLIWKFRTMRQVAGSSVTVSGDDRIHPLGQLLRQHKLDELPQLVNVLRGEMSLVGPRPEVAKYVAHWPPAEREKILSVRPGITDPASIRFSSESDILAQSEHPERTYIDEILPLKVSMYTDYVTSKTMVGDLKIIVATLQAVMNRSGTDR